MLAGRGEAVRAVDSGHPQGAAGLEGVGVEVFLDTDGLAQLDGTRTVVKSPGVPREAPVIAAALEREIEILGEVELAWRALPNRFLAVTGTNGKTTTVELLGHLYRSAGEPVAVAGNVGTALSELVGEVAAEETIVCECSSFQLEDTVAFAP
jgi:UDP-N-acetylmuramoylalanine--D-glutamate ligase